MAFVGSLSDIFQVVANGCVVGDFAVAEKVGVDEVISLSETETKVDVVQRLQRRGERVVLVGDGVGDAAGLATADVGIALGSGTEVTSQTGDVVLIGDELYGVVYALAIGKRPAEREDGRRVQLPGNPAGGGRSGRTCSRCDGYGGGICGRSVQRPAAQKNQTR